MILQYILVFFALFISDVFWVKCIKSVQETNPFSAASWAIGIFLPTALVTVAYVDNRWLLIPACLGHFAGTYYTVKWEQHKKDSKGILNFSDNINKFIFKLESEER